MFRTTNLDLSGEHLGVEQRLDGEAAVPDHGLLQGGGPLADAVPLVLDRVLLHPRLETLPQPAEAALVPLVLVHRAVPVVNTLKVPTELRSNFHNILNKDDKGKRVGYLENLQLYACFLRTLLLKNPLQPSHEAAP